MSKGFGPLQAGILDALRSRAEVSAPRLLWELAEQNGRIHRDVDPRPLPSGAIPNAFYNSFRRSICLLRERKAVKVRQHKLQNLAELVDLYPYMTRDLGVKELRHRLLPHAIRYIREHGSKYDLEENELYLGERASDDERAEWRAGWLKLEDRICAASALCRGHSREALIAILARGRELFVRNQSTQYNSFSYFHYEDSLHNLLTSFSAQVLDCSGEHRSLASDLRLFYAQCFPDSVIKHVALKSQLHGIWEAASLGAPRLTTLFRDYLLDVESTLISSFPRRIPASGSYRTLSRKDVSFGELLEQLFSRNVFGPVQFLSTSA